MIALLLLVWQLDGRVPRLAFHDIEQVHDLVRPGDEQLAALSQPFIRLRPSPGRPLAYRAPRALRSGAVSEKGLNYRIPRLELLLAYKIKAYHDRNFEISKPETARGNLVSYFISKREKDGSDILAMLDPDHSRRKVQFDDGFMRELIRQHGFEREAKEVVTMIAERPGSRNLYSKIDDNESKALLLAFSRRLGL